MKYLHKKEATVVWRDALTHEKVSEGECKHPYWRLHEASGGCCWIDLIAKEGRVGSMTSTHLALSSNAAPYLPIEQERRWSEDGTMFVDQQHKEAFKRHLSTMQLALKVVDLRYSAEARTPALAVLQDIGFIP